MSEEARGTISKVPVPLDGSDDVQVWIQKVIGDVRAAVNAFSALPSATVSSTTKPTKQKRGNKEPQRDETNRPFLR